MRTKMLLAVLIATVACGAAWADVLYQNDYGTANQFNALYWTDSSGLEVTTTLGNPPGDLDSDGLYAGVRCTSAYVNWRYGAKAIYASPFNLLSNPTVSGYGAGTASHASAAAWYLSQDNATYDHGVATDNSNYWKQYTTPAAAHSDPAYTGMKRFYAVNGMKHYSGGAYNPVYAGRVGALEVSADSTAAQVGDNVNIHLNDFGTQAQRDEWTLTSGLEFYERLSVDTDMDDLAMEMRSTGGTQTATIRIDAPNGYRFANPVATGVGYGSANNYGSSTRVQLSLDGVNWDVTSDVPAATNGWYNMAADSTGVTGYDDITSVWLRVYMSSWHASYKPQAYGITMDADIVAVPEPATMLLLSLGFVGLARKRR